MMNTVAFFPVRAPLTALFQYVNGGSCKDLADKGIAYMENYELTVNSYDFCWGGSELHTFTSAEVRKLRVEAAEPTNNIMCRGMATHWGILKGSWLSNQFESYL